MISRFDQAYEEWMHSVIAQEQNHRRRELLEKGLGYGTCEFLRSVWFPAVRNFNHLYPEWEVRDFYNGYRYLDLATDLTQEISMCDALKTYVGGIVY